MMRSSSKLQKYGLNLTLNLVKSTEHDRGQERNAAPTPGYMKDEPALSAAVVHHVGEGRTLTSPVVTI